jgi:hypothetical protein
VIFFRLQNLFISNLILLILLVIFPLSSYADPLVKRTMISGVRLTTVHSPIERTGWSVVVSADADRIRNVTLPSSKSIGKSSFITDYVASKTSEIIVNGGYSQSFSPLRPLGLFKIDGRILNQIHNSWLLAGFICTDNGRLIIFSNEKKEEIDRFESCIQAGPLFINDGIFRYTSLSAINQPELRLINSIQSSTFLCQTQTELIVGYSDDIRVINLLKFVSDRFDCKMAIRLSGGETAALAINLGIVAENVMPNHHFITLKSQ